ncbi:carbohydrate binding domain-containing protein [Sediminitomix flava]|uniref:Carbohydrate binding protein n=1 Tax=Sediminitomix flava TaxID=379075 RepID=A0A315YXX8_SEDFL|nr:carbohydrate binding domain-containing protein [Sediminitomix flava]PWJ34982.1 carbohydrate binding protein [Sediminitomix flava]
MKNKFITLALSLLAFFTYSCEEEYVEPNTFSDIAFYNSNFRAETFVVKGEDTIPAMFIGVNDFISFSDLSHNAVDHKWTIPLSAEFLEGRITRDDEDYTQFIVDKGGNTSTENTINVFFTEGSATDLFEVNLRNTFKDSVSFKGVDTLESVYEDGLWVIDTTFSVFVFDTIEVEMEVRQFDEVTGLFELIDQENTDTIYVEAGDVLEFADVTTIGLPDTRKWEIAGDVYTDEVIQPTFKKLGMASVFLTASRTGLNIPPDQDRYKFPIPIKVIPSTKPFVQQGDLVETIDHVIRIPFNGEFTNLPADAKDYFSVKINGVAGSVKSVALDASDATIIELSLFDAVYSDDEILVSYSGGLESTDTRQSESFTDLPVTMFIPNLFSADIYGFEDGGVYWGPTFDNVGELTYNSTEQVASGNYSMKMVSSSGDWTFAQCLPESGVAVEAGKTYIFSYKVYVEPGSALPFVAPWITKPSGNKQFWESINSFKQGEWVTINKEWTANADEEISVQIRIKNTGTIYVDDFSLIAKDNFRPAE